MLFVKETFKYLKKSVFALIVLAAVPAVILGLFFPFFSTLSFIPIYIKSVDAGFAKIFWMLFSKTGITHVYPILLAASALIIFGSYILSVLEKHFKTGRLLLRNPFSSVNNSVMTVLKIFPLGVVIITVLLVFQVSIVSLVRAVVTGVTENPVVLDCFWTVIISLLFFLISAIIIVFMGAWAVIIQIFGFSFQDAFMESVRIISKKWFSFFNGFILPIFILLIVPIVLNSVPSELRLVKIITNIAIYLCVIVYYFAYIMVSIYMLTGLERRDKKTIVPKSRKNINKKN